MKNDMRNYTTRTVAKRTPETQAQIDAARAMPGGPNQDRIAAPKQTDAAREAKTAPMLSPAPRKASYP